MRTIGSVGRVWLAAWACMAAAGALQAGQLFTAEYAAPAPAGYVLESGVAKGEVEGEVASLTIAVRVRLLQDGWVEVPLLSGNLAVTTAKVEGGERQKVFLRRRGKTLSLVANHRGTVTVTLVVASRVSVAEGQRRVRLPLVQGVAASTELTLPAANVAFSTSPQMDASQKELADGRTAVTLYGAPAASVELTWSTQPRLADLEPLVFVAHRAHAEIGRGAFRITSTLDYTVLQGTVQELALDMPKEASLLSVTGDGIERWDTTPTGLTVRLAERIKRDYRLKVVTEAPLTKLPADLPIPLVGARAVQREKGTVSLEAQKGIKVEPGQSKGVRQMDVAELGAHIGAQRRQMPSLPSAPDLAFRFLRRPVEIRVRAAPVEPKVTARVLSAVVASQETLHTVNTILYDIREAGVFRFRLRIPEGSKLLDVRCAHLNTWQMEKDVLTVELRTKAEGAYTLTVENEQLVKQDTRFQPLELLDVERQTGHVAVSSRKGTKVEIADKPSGGAVQIDIEELPPELRPEERPVELGFRTIRHPFAIPLVVGAVQPQVYVVNSSLIRLEERELKLETHLDVDIRKSGIFELRLTFPRELRLADDIRGPNIEDWRQDRENETLAITFQGKVSGQLQVVLRAEMTLEEDYQGLRVPRVVAQNVKKEVGYLAFATALAIRMSAPPDQVKGLNPIALTELSVPLLKGAPRDEMALAFKFLKPDWTLDLAIEPIQPVVNALATSRVELSSTVEYTTARVQYEIRQAGIDTFYLEFPAGARAVEIEGQHIKERSPIDALPAAEGAEEAEAEQDTGRPIWRVVLQKKIKPKYGLAVSFERALGAGTQDKRARVSYEGVKALRVQREEGYVVLAARTNVEVEPPKIDKAYPVDPSQIPDQSLVLQGAPAIWACQYMAHPYSLTLDVIKHEDVEVITAVANLAWFETVVARDGRSITDLFLIMRNNNQQYLKLKVPEGAEIWEAKVNAQTVDAARDKFDRVLVPIAGASQSGVEFQVSLRYEQKFGELDQWSELDLVAPALSIPVLRCLWDVYVPEEMSLVNLGGNMSEIPAEEEAGIVAYYRQSRRRVRERQAELQQQQIQRNAPDLQRGKRGPIGQRSLDTGEAPKAGKVYFRFEKIMALDVGQEARAVPPVRLELVLMRDAFGYVMTLLVVLVFVGGMAYNWTQPGRRRIQVFASLCLLFFVIWALAPDFYYDLVWMGGVMSILGLLVALGHLGVVWGRAWAAERPATQPLPAPKRVGPAPDSAARMSGTEDSTTGPEPTPQAGDAPTPPSDREPDDAGGADRSEPDEPASSEGPDKEGSA